ncbi:MAG: hypothetical protein LBT12_05455 [Oscillospiraceae bacterium]|jgi:hypothetical protein|nr:hypothetical protein [Oscillospiraceae bacterium]
MGHKDCAVCGCAMTWRHPTLPEHVMESSCNLEDWHICHDCMVEHCLSTNCLGCAYGNYPACRFLELKAHYTKGENA